jgi:class 3 adenylate cyclase
LRRGESNRRRFGSRRVAPIGGRERATILQIRAFAEIPEDRRIELRIGINVGDIIIEGEDIYGDGVNIAARLEGIAEAGGICISRQVFDQIEGKVKLAYRQMGPQNLKKIAKPIEVFAVEVDEPGGTVGQSRPSQEIKYCRTPDGVRLA